METIKPDYVDTEGSAPKWKQKIHEIIFEADTPAGKYFDVTLLYAIILSVLAVLLETVPSLKDSYGDIFFYMEWGFTILFSIEYILRVISVGKPFKYIFSFMGIIDFLSIVPTYLSLIVVGSHYLMVIRTIRLLRVFRVLKLARYVREAQILAKALKASMAKITVFIGVVFVLVLIMGTLMYLVEGPEHGFTSIPRSMYWTIVTITTVGYGDITPQTTVGQMVASMVMLLGYAIIAVPTGIVTAEMTRVKPDGGLTNNACPQCSKEGHDKDANNCKYCGAQLGF